MSISGREGMHLGAHFANQSTVRIFFPYVTLVKNKVYDVFPY